MQRRYCPLVRLCYLVVQGLFWHHFPCPCLLFLEWIRSPLEPRKRRDTVINPTHILPSMRITSPGRIVGWRIYAQLPGEIFMQVSEMSEMSEMSE